MREKMPNRRHQVVVNVIVNERKYQIAVGFTNRGLVKEVWGTGPKIGSTMWAILQDMCRSFSRQLQEGVPPLTLAGQAERYPNDKAVSIYGVIADILVEQQKVIHEAITTGNQATKEP